MKKLMMLALVAMFASFSVSAVACPGPKARHHHAKQCQKGKKGKCHKGGVHKRMNKTNVPPVTPR